MTDETVEINMPDGSVTRAKMVPLDGTGWLDESLRAMGHTHWPNLVGFEVFQDGNGRWVARPAPTPIA